MIKTYRCKRIKQLEKKLGTLSWLLTKSYKDDLHVEYNTTLKELQIQLSYREHELNNVE